MVSRQNGDFKRSVLSALAALVAAAVPSLGSPVTVDRGGLEGQSLALVDCHGAPRDVAREELSLLARPWSAPRPKLVGPGNEHGHGHLHAAPVKGVKLPEGEIAPGVRL